MANTPPGPDDKARAGRPGRGRVLLRAASTGRQRGPGPVPGGGAYPRPPASRQVVAATPALDGRPGGPGIAVDPAAGPWPAPGAFAWQRRASVWQRLQLPWDGAGIVWAPSMVQTQPPPLLAAAPVSAGAAPSPAVPPGTGQQPEWWEGEGAWGGWPGAGEGWDGSEQGPGAGDRAADFPGPPQVLAGAPVSAGAVPGPAAAPGTGQPPGSRDGDGEQWYGDGEDWDGDSDSAPVPAAGDGAADSPRTRPLVFGAPVSAGAAPATGQPTDWWTGDGQWEHVEQVRDEGDSLPADAARIQPRPAFLSGLGGAGPRRAPSGAGRPVRRRPVRPRMAIMVAAAVALLIAVAVLLFAVLTRHTPETSQSAADQQGYGTSSAALAQFPAYPGQQQRGVFATIGRIVASGNTIVAIGSQATDNVVREQFLVSTDGGDKWRLAPVHGPNGGQPPAGHPALRVAGGPGGWLGIGPQATWTSLNGQSWMLSANHGITPMRPGDNMWVLNSTSDGFLAAGMTADGNGVIWTSSDGLTWQRKTAAQLGLDRGGLTVGGISYITSHGEDTVMSGMVTARTCSPSPRTGHHQKPTLTCHNWSYSAGWLSTDGGSTWTAVTVPVDHGASNWITGLGFDQSGLIAVRPGSSPGGGGDGVAYFSPDGRTWQYAATIEAAGGWKPSLVKGSDYGFVVTGTSAAGRILAYTSAGNGTSWQPTAPLGNAAGETVAGATVAPSGTIIAIGSATASTVSQQPVLLEALAGDGMVQQISLTGLPGAVVPEQTVNGLAVAGSQQMAVGSADGYPAVWRTAPGHPWSLVTSLAQVSAGQSLSALTAVTHGRAGWLAVGAPDPVVLTSANGTTWQTSGTAAADLASVTAVDAAAGPGGYVIVGKLPAPGGGFVADVWWSSDLVSWTRAQDVNDVSGSNQVLTVAAGAHGFVSAGSHNGQPAVWTSANGLSWTTTVLPLAAGASGGVLQQVAIDGNHVVALGQETTAIGSVPFAEVSADGGTTWTRVAFIAPGTGVTFTALTADADGFTAAAQFGNSGQQRAAAWTSANGTTWLRETAGGLTGLPGGDHHIGALAVDGQAVIGVASVTTQQSNQFFAVTLPGS